MMYYALRVALLTVSTDAEPNVCERALGRIRRIGADLDRLFDSGRRR